MMVQKMANFNYLRWLLLRLKVWWQNGGWSEHPKHCDVRNWFFQTFWATYWDCYFSLVTFSLKYRGTVVHEGTKSQNQGLYKAIIWWCFNLNWLFWTIKHNILLSGIEIKWIYAISRDLKIQDFANFVFFGCKIDDCS